MTRPDRAIVEWQRHRAIITRPDGTTVTLDANPDTATIRAHAQTTVIEWRIVGDDMPGLIRLDRGFRID